MNKTLPLIAALLVATPAAAQFTGETVSFPLGVDNSQNRIEYVTRLKNINFFTETAVKHSILGGSIAIFDIINGRAVFNQDDVFTVNNVRFYYANCGTLEYQLYAYTQGDRASLNNNIVYVTDSVVKHAGGTTPEGIRAGEICRDVDMLYK